MLIKAVHESIPLIKTERRNILQKSKMRHVPNKLQEGQLKDGWIPRLNVEGLELKGN